MLLRTLAFALAVPLTVCIAWASQQAAIGESFASIVQDPWGIVTLVDLYTGFIVTSALVFLLERERRVSLVVVIATFFLGNVITALWLAWRLPRLRARIRGGAATNSPF